MPTNNSIGMIFQWESLVLANAFVSSYIFILKCYSLQVSFSSTVDPLFEIKKKREREHGVS